MRTGRSAAQSPNPSRGHPRRGIVSAWLIGSALIALALAFLPIGTGPSSASGMAIRGTMSNGALKGDRLPIRRAVSIPKGESSAPSKIPVGCEAAFSKLVRVGNFTSRCVT